ncbi:MAG: thioredoxin family protein [Lentisphaeria bacterium]|nr:thioredoxin family protein [Lentisphaeria bacterium]
MRTIQILAILLLAAMICSAAPMPGNNSPHKATSGKLPPPQPGKPESKEPFVVGGEHGMKAPGRSEKGVGPDARPVDHHGVGPDARPVDHHGVGPDARPVDHHGVGPDARPVDHHGVGPDARPVDHHGPAIPGHKVTPPRPKVHFEPPCKPLPPPKPHLQIPHPVGVTTPDGWFDDWNAACREAKRLDRPILVLFTGSDWCHWCKVLHKEVLDTFAFRNFASQKLVLVYMDQPSKVKLPSSLVHAREQLARLLHVGNGVPCTVLLSPNGHRWDEIGGYDEDYLQVVRKILHKHGY